MDERIDSSKVNTSYTLFFLLSTVAVSFSLSTAFGELQNESWLILMLNALLIYFIWDFIKQLYSPGQSIILYFVTFSLLPFVMAMTIGNEFYKAGIIIWIIAMIFAGLLEIMYEYAFKSIAPKNFLKRLFIVDDAFDKSLVRINIHHITFSNYKGITFAMVLIVTYYTISYLLLG